MINGAILLVVGDVLINIEMSVVISLMSRSCADWGRLCVCVHMDECTLIFVNARVVIEFHKKK